MQPLFTVCLLTFAISLTLRTPENKPAIQAKYPIADTIYSQEAPRDTGFYASNITFQFISKKGKTMPLPSQKVLDEIRIKFDIEAVGQENAEKWIYFVMMEPEGQSIVNLDLGPNYSGGTFTIDGKALVYTHKHRMNYQGKDQTVFTVYKVGEDFPSGRIYMDIYCGGKKIARNQFFVAT